VLGFAEREDAELGEGRRWIELVPPAGGRRSRWCRGSRR